jgi:tetratricopeptide (TPR) repeat protein
VARELWQDYRLARIYASDPPQPQGSPPVQPLSRLFHNRPSLSAAERLRAAQNAAPELADAFRTFSFLRRRAPNRHELSLACAQIADWASGRSMMVTAVEFARSAASISPTDSEAANLAALMLRRTGDWKRAEQFYARAIGLARRCRRDPDRAVRRRAKIEYICAHIGMAALFYSQGMNFPRAVKHLNTAARVAAEGHIGWLAAHVRHDSMLLLLEKADFSAAEEEAGRAAELYPLHDKRFPYFVTDFGLVQVMQRRYRVAIPLLQLSLQVIAEPSIRGMISSMLARAYAALGVTTEFERHWQWASALVAKHAELSPATHYHLAEAARACRSWDEAEQHARCALELALAREDREVARHAERVLADVHTQTVTPPQPSSGPEALTSELQVRMKRWNPENHRGRPRRVAFRNQWVA